MDLLDGPDDGLFGSEPEDTDTIAMDTPQRSWERHWEKWHLRWRQTRRTTRAAIAGVAVLVLGGGAGVAYALTHSAAPAATQATGTGNNIIAAMQQAQWANGPRGKPWAVVSTGNSVPAGASSQVQAGTVTAVGRTSLTLNSPNGYTATYSVIPATEVNFTNDGIGSVHKGQTVEVIALKTGKNAVALVIENFTATGQGRQGSG